LAEDKQMRMVEKTPDVTGLKPETFPKQDSVFSLYHEAHHLKLFKGLVISGTTGRI
jgi:predicted DNA-binding protein (UPF0251 family)